MRALCFMSLIICLSGCSEFLTSKKDTDFSRNQSEVVDVQYELQDGSKILLLNKENQTPRLIEKDLDRVSKFSTESKLAKEDLQTIALQAANELFPGVDVSVTDIQNGLVFQYVTLQQFHLDRPVVGAELSLRITNAGDWVSMTSSIQRLEDLPHTTPELQEVQIQSFIPASAEVTERHLVIYPRKENGKFSNFFAEEFHISDARSHTGYLLWIDQVSGEIIGEFNPEHGAKEKTVYGSILPNDAEDQVIRVALPDMEIKVGTNIFSFNKLGSFDFQQIFGETAEVRLKNPYITVVNNGGSDNGGLIHVTEEFLSQGAVLDFDKNSTLEERNIYYWVMKAREYLENELDFHKMNYEIAAFAQDGIKMDNAYFNPIFKLLGKPILGFGTGDKFFKNTALSRDIILHEYGHAVTFEIYGLNGMKKSYEFSAMNEAFSDYFAATITDDPLIGEDMILDPTRPYLRRVDSDMFYPKSFKGTRFHEDGQMFSGALWQLRERVGAALADRMIHEARLSKAASIREFYASLLRIAIAGGNAWGRTDLKTSVRQSFREYGLTTRTKFETPEQEDLTIPWSNCWGMNSPDENI